VSDASLTNAAIAMGLPPTMLDEDTLAASGGRIRIPASRIGFAPRGLRLADGAPAVARSARTALLPHRGSITIDARIGGAEVSSEDSSAAVAGRNRVYSIVLSASFVEGSSGTYVWYFFRFFFFFFFFFFFTCYFFFRAHAH
jgi:hypothetical protein